MTPPTATAATKRIGRFHKGVHDTEVAAAVALYPRSGTQRAAVLRALRRAGKRGLTDFECARRCGFIRPHIAGTRREELIADGFPIVKTDGRRPTDTGCTAIVWRFER